MSRMSRQPQLAILGEATLLSLHNDAPRLKHVNPSAADSPSVSAKNHVARHIGTLARKTKVEIIRVHLQGEAIVCSIFHDP